MRPSVGVKARIYRAWKRLESEEAGDVNQAKLGDLIAAELERDKPLSQGRVSEILRIGTRDVDLLWAIARATGVDFVWLATGEGSMLTELARRKGETEIEENPAPTRTGEEFEQEEEIGEEEDAPEPRRAVAGARGASPPKKRGGSRGQRR